jgi:hypothetical protein
VRRDEEVRAEVRRVARVGGAAQRADAQDGGGQLPPRRGQDVPPAGDRRGQLDRLEALLGQPVDARKRLAGAVLAHDGKDHRAGDRRHRGVGERARTSGKTGFPHAGQC